jgi:hypothetical protein
MRGSHFFEDKGGVEQVKLWVKAKAKVKVKVKDAQKIFMRTLSIVGSLFAQLFVHQDALVFQALNLLAPVTLGAKPCEMLRKGRVFDPRSQPSTVVNHSERSKSLDQSKLFAIKGPHALVAF